MKQVLHAELVLQKNHIGQPTGATPFVMGITRDPYAIYRRNIPRPRCKKLKLFFEAAGARNYDSGFAATLNWMLYGKGKCLRRQDFFHRFRGCKSFTIFR